MANPVEDLTPAESINYESKTFGKRVIFFILLNSFFFLLLFPK